MEANVSFNEEKKVFHTELETPNHETNNVSCFNRSVKAIKHSIAANAGRFLCYTTLGLVFSLLAYSATSIEKREVSNIADHSNMSAIDKKNLTALYDNNNNISFYCLIASHTILSLLLLGISRWGHKRTENSA